MLFPTATRQSSSGAADNEQSRVRSKLRKFLTRRPTLQSVKEKGYIKGEPLSSDPPSETSRRVFKITAADTSWSSFYSFLHFLLDNVFGCHLDTLCHRENTTVPRFVEKCIKSVERRGKRERERAEPIRLQLFHNIIYII